MLTRLTLFTLSSAMVFGAIEVWTGAVDSNWGTVGNWTGGNPIPMNGDELIFNSTAVRFLSTNNLPSIALNLIIIDSNTSYLINGNQIGTTGMPTPMLNLNPTPANTAIHTVAAPILLSSDLIINQSGPTTNCSISGVISGPNDLFYSGGGAFFLTGVNTYMGGTFVLTGSNLFSTTLDMPVTPLGIIIDIASTFTFGQTFNGSFAGLLTGQGDFHVATTGQSITITNTGNNYSGLTQIDAMTTLIGTTSTIPSNNGCQFLAAASVLNFDQAFTGTFSAPITGPGSVLINGGGTVILSSLASNYTAGTTIATATLSVSADANMGAAAGVLNLGTAAADLPMLQTSASFTTGRPITVNATTSRIDPNGFILTHTGAATGTGGLHSGRGGGAAGTLQVEGPYSYTGSTFVDLGILQLSTGSATLPPPGVSPSGDLTLALGTTFDMSGAGIPAQSIGNLSGTGNTMLGANSLAVTISLPTTYNGIISGVGGHIIKNGSATWTLGGTNTYSGGTTINGGTLAITGNLPVLGFMAINAGTLDISAAAGPQVIGTLTGAGTLTMGTTTLGYQPTGNSTFSGSIQGTGTFNFTSPATLNLSGSNPFSGSFTMAAGTTLQGGAVNAFPPASYTLATGSLLQLNGFSQTIDDLSGTGNATFTSGETLTTGGSNHSTSFGGVISGPGVLTKVGTGTFTLTNAETYSDGTNINGGTLQLQGAGAHLPANGNLSVASGAIFDMSGAGVPAQSIGNLSGAGNTLLGANSLTVTISSPTTYNGAISGVGGQITKNGSATWTLGGANTYSGGTTINGGTLKAGASDTFPSTGLITINPGTTLALNGHSQVVGNITGSGSFITFSSGEVLLVGDSTNQIYSGEIQGPGILEKLGTGSLTLEGTNSYSHGTSIVNGTLAIAASGNIPPTGPMTIFFGTFDISAATNPQTIGTLSGGGFINLGAQTLTSNPTANSTYSGDITGTGTFILNQPFTLTLSGTSTTTGTVEIAQGTINVTGTVPANFIIESPGKLKGTGTVGAINNSGIVAPGGSIGTLHVIGNYIESKTLQIEVNDTGAASLVAIGGNLTINSGTDIMLIPDMGTYSTPLTYTIATFGGSRTGTYSSIQTTLFNRFKATAIYDPHDIKIEFITVPFLEIIPGVPAAKCIESIPKSPGSDGQFIINTLETFSNDLSVLKNAFLQMQPNQYGALALAQENNDILIRSALTQRFEYRCAQDCFNLAETSEEQMPSENSLKGSAWFEPLGKYANQNNQQQNAGYHLYTGGALLGTDYQFLGQLDFGGAVGYTFTDLDWRKSAGKAFINSYYGTLYGTWFLKRVFVDATIISAYNHYHAQRNIHFPGIDRHAQNSHGGYQIAESLGTGVFFNPGAFQITPYARADYVFLHQSSFTEHGAKSLDLKIKDTNSRYVRSDLGFKISHCHTYRTVKVTPYVKFSWIWEKQLDEARFNSSFINSSCVFTVHGLRPVRSLFAPSIGMTILGHQDTFSFSLYYDAEVGKKFWESRGYGNFSFKY